MGERQPSARNGRQIHFCKSETWSSKPGVQAKIINSCKHGDEERMRMRSFLVRLGGLALLSGSMMVGQGKAPEERQAPKFDIANIDRSLDPCVDFYQYACSNWIKNNPIPSDYSEWISLT